MPKPAHFTGRPKWIWAETENWTTPELVNGNPYPVAYFRRLFTAPAGARLTVCVSADSRYLLWCNGKRVGRGPAKGDVRHHFYETYCLDDYLEAGKNVLAAQVISFAPARTLPWESGAPNSVMTAGWYFVLEGTVRDRDGVEGEILDSDRNWKALLDTAYRHRHRDGWGTYLGMFEDLDGSRYPWKWQTLDFDDSAWKPAYEVMRAVPEDDSSGLDNHVPNILTPREIPFLEETGMHFDGAARSEGVPVENWAGLISAGTPLVIPANRRASVTIYCNELTTGFPNLVVNGGAGAKIQLTYNEALHFDGKKSPRHAPETGDVIGYFDRFYPSGGQNTYEPLHWRTFRYLRLDVKTENEPITLVALTYRFTGYPFEQLASFRSSDPVLSRMWDMSWRTVRLCAHETYEDCPYYEQLQYTFDTHLQALISYYVTGDARLARQAIRHFAWSRGPDGITQSRYPSRMPQYIPSCSLLWVGLVRDYWWHTGDLAEATKHLDGIAANLRWFEQWENADGLLEAVPYWKVVDWVAEWSDPYGYPPGADQGVSGILNLHYVYALTCAAEIATAAGEGRSARLWNAKARRIGAVINRCCWWEQQGLYRDQPGGSELSEHMNAWAIITGVASTARMSRIAQRLGSDPALAAATLYGRFFVFRALSKAGVYERAYRLLDHWETMMRTDLTTWAEEPYLDRSYCHMWSTTPLYEFLAEIAGIKPSEPGFSRVRIQPHMWHLSWAEASIPTPRGTVAGRWERNGEKFTLTASGPEGTPIDVIMPDGRHHQVVGAGPELHAIVATQAKQRVATEA